MGWYSQAMPPIILASLLFLVLASLLAFMRGGWWEKTVAVVLLVAWGLSSALPFDKVNPPWEVIAVDTGVFLVLLYACLRSTRRWLVFAAAFQFLVLATHYVFVRNQELMQWAYVSAYYVWNIGLIASLCLGAVVGGSRNKQGIERRDQ